MKEKVYIYEDSFLIQLLSNVLSPPIFASLVFAIACFKTIPDCESALTLFGICFLFQSLLPVIYLFTTLKLQTISDIHLFRKEERNLVFPTFVALYGTGFLMLRIVHAPSLISAMMLSSMILISCVWGINVFYKISVHAVGIAGLLTGMFFVFGPQAFALELFIPFVAWVRLKARAHVLSEIVNGAILGHLVSYAILKLYH